MALSITACLNRGAATSKEIQFHTGLSQAAVSRKIRELGDNVVRYKEGKTVHYALTRAAFGGNDKLPLGMVDGQGNTVLVAMIRPLAHGGFLVEPAAAMSPLLLGESGSGMYDDLPYFLADACPQGFLGRQIAKALANQHSAFPADPRLWNTNHRGRYLVANGDDLPGNFTFGEQALLRPQRRLSVTSEDEYPVLADAVLRGVLPGSSAGGEQPKFTALTGRRRAHVIVKFSPKGTSEVARRWRDILITEFHAAQAMHAKQYPAATTRLLQQGERIFLESERFDRVGEYGRNSMISLGSIDAEFSGIGAGWPQVMQALYQQNLVSQRDVTNVAVLWSFGKFINNTDMHLGNVSMAMEDGIFRLLPLYDMCSMGFAPQSGGELQPYAFQPSLPELPFLPQDVQEIVFDMAKDFWERVAVDPRISDGLKTFLSKGNPVALMA